jgi:hypothetical protein
MWEDKSVSKLHTSLVFTLNMEAAKLQKIKKKKKQVRFEVFTAVGYDTVR